MADVFLITIDALRHDHFNQDYFPECWNHFQDFAYFKNGYSNGVATPLSFPSIHTGYTVEGDGKLNEDTPTVAELYDEYTFGISNNPYLRRDRGYDRGFDSFSRRPSEQKSSRLHAYSRIKQIAGRSNLIRRLHSWTSSAIEEHTEKQPDLSPSYDDTAEFIFSVLTRSMESRNGFFWVHLIDPHYPYYPQKILDKDLDVAYSNSEIEMINRKVQGAAMRSLSLERQDKDLPPPTEEELEFCHEIYGEIVKYVDRCLARFLKHLKENGRWNESMIIILSDHGEAFGEEGVFRHDWLANPIDTLVRVPIVVKYPNGEHAGETYDHSVQNADLLATLSEVLGWDVDLPPHTRPFTDPRSRPVISKSNIAVRVTTDSGYAIRRDNSIVDMVGDISDEALSVLESSLIPSVETLSGEIPGLADREQKEVEERLEHLGYK